MVFIIKTPGEPDVKTEYLHKMLIVARERYSEGKSVNLLKDGKEVELWMILDEKREILSQQWDREDAENVAYWHAKRELDKDFAFGLSSTPDKLEIAEMIVGSFSNYERALAKFYNTERRD